MPELKSVSLVKRSWWSHRGQCGAAGGDKHTHSPSLSRQHTSELWLLWILLPLITLASGHTHACQHTHRHTHMHTHTHTHWQHKHIPPTNTYPHTHKHTHTHTHWPHKHTPTHRPQTNTHTQTRLTHANTHAISLYTHTQKKHTVVNTQLENPIKHCRSVLTISEGLLNLLATWPLV